MLSTLKAVVKNDRIEWQEAVGELIPRDQPVEVLVTILHPQPIPEPPAGQIERRLEALRQLQALGGVKSIEDPVQWQREIRADRDLPGRE